MKQVSDQMVIDDNAFFTKMLGMVPAYVLAPEQPRQEGEDQQLEANIGQAPQADHQGKQKKQKHIKKRKTENASAEEDDELFGSDNSFTTLKKQQTVSSATESAIPESSTEAAETGTLLSTSLADIDEKRSKLRAKIEELQAKRKLNDRDKMSKKRLKRQESKMKLKEKRIQEKMSKRPQIVNGGETLKGNNSVPTTPSKPIYNKEGQMVFSKFDFTDSAKKQKKGKHNSDLTGKDYKRLLEKIEKRNEKIQKVTSKDKEQGKSLQDKFRWDSILHKAEGQKVKDNPELLKKSLKRKEKIRDKKKLKWDDRVSQVKKLQDTKVKKRNDNLQKRKQSVKDKKVQKLKKKGRMLPGF